ncbi:MAG TPA: hypothetical protein VFC39_02555 [Acidobacteriaceae bacterium]|nr:hypothetical protein [Acidobacteriaceae bacterium]
MTFIGSMVAQIFLPEKPVRVLSLAMILCQSWSAYALPVSAPSVELSQGWKLVSARDIEATGAAISLPSFDTKLWYPIRHMPATALEVLQEDGVYPNLYLGMNLLKTVPHDLYKQAWWYRTVFTAPSGYARYTLQFPGINYRAEIWLNGARIADSSEVVGMYSAHEFDVSQWIRPGAGNVLAIKVIPEQKIQDVDGVELADSWHDWINWKYLGLIPPGGGNHGVSFVPDRNAGVWKPVILRPTGKVTIEHATVNTDLPLPRTDEARLTIYATVRNLQDNAFHGLVRMIVGRSRTTTLRVERTIDLAPHEVREVKFSPNEFAQLHLKNPDLWWPYTMGKPNLYDLTADVVQHSQISDETHIRFGIRVITQHRDDDEEFPEMGKGGSFYLKVNGKDFRIRGAVYSPDLLYKDAPDRQAAIMRYVKDVGLNLLRWESKISSERMLDLADEEGVPVMMGWMCCAQWEKWPQWDDEDRRVAVTSLQSQIEMLRSHPSAVLWANGSDGLPPEAVLSAYHRTLVQLHWQNAVVDTVSSLAHDSAGNILWSGIHMRGPYTWRPPTYWFSGRYAAARGACAEQGDNEHIPPFESLKKFIPKDKLWPINDAWYFHAGANQGNSTLANIQHVIDERYGPSHSAEEFTQKAQLAHYENTRAQFEAFAAGAWADHKMTLYWMLDDPWPSFFGHLFGHDLQPGGAYFGARKGLRPLSIVFDSYATGDHSKGRIVVTNQTPADQQGLKARVRMYDLQGKLRYERRAKGIAVATNGDTEVFNLPRRHDLGRVYFVRCDLFTKGGVLLEENVYWQSNTVDDVGDPRNDKPFQSTEVSWADFKPLWSMPPVKVDIVARRVSTPQGPQIAIHMHNTGSHIAFSERAEVTGSKGGDELLPIQYDDNYVTLFPGESMEIRATFFSSTSSAAWIKLSGINTSQQTARIQ